ncbi:protein phosphatase 1 regulatory subunit 3A-like [Acipenser ruthenus]|uniref:protein phosphatase 1 regulatory subunit 3A-like n=1 Tax=Acipenser ruthenus TaxID=7906 RepID=UPI00155FF62F|nr:protein phosphatase 1 regulatory subunit 3A-like [Acipenser ruthenus]
MESTGEPRRFGAPNFLEVTASNSCDEDEDESKIKPKSSPIPRRRSSSSSDDSEAEGPPVITRKVSFADAFGLNLVRVKEFDSWDVPTTSFTDTFEDEVPSSEEYFLSSVFVVPSSHDELMQKLYEQKVELESFEFVPGGLTAMKGIIRVFNVCFEKLVYVRMTLDAWNSYYDLMAQYVPGSSDGETDQFSFKISLVPPYQKDGGKVEFCIRYETSVGTFWANNNGLNYVLFCHKKEIPEVTKKTQEENTDKNIKSCLKTINSKGNATVLDDTLVQPGTPDLSKNKTEVVVSEAIENLSPNQEAPHGDTTQLDGDYKEQLQPQMDQNQNPTPINQSNMGTNSSAAEKHNYHIHDHSFKKTKVYQIHSEEQPDIKKVTEASDHKIGIPHIWEKGSIPSPTCDENQTSTRDNRNPESLETFSQTFKVQSWQCSQEAESTPEDVLPSKEDTKYVYREDAPVELEQEKNIPLGDKVFRRTTEHEVLEILFTAEEEEDANVLNETSEMELPHYRKFSLDHTSEEDSSLEAKDQFKSKSDLSKDNITSYEYNVKVDIVMGASNEEVCKDIGTGFHEVNNRDQKTSSATSQEVIKKEVRLDSENTSNSFLEDGNLLGSDNLASCSKQKENKTIQENIKEEWSYDIKVSESGLDKKHLIPRIMDVATHGVQVDELSNKHECESMSANKTHEKASTEPPQEKETVCQEDITKASQQGYTQTQPLQDIMQQANARKESILDLYNDENIAVDTEPDTSTSKYEAVQYITSIQETHTEGEVRPTKTYVENEAFIFSKHNGGTQEESNSFYTAIKPESSLSGQIVNVSSDDTSTCIEEDIYTDHHYSLPGNKGESNQIAITNEPSEEMSVQQVNEKNITTETADVKMSNTAKNTTSNRRGRHNTITSVVKERLHEGHQQKLLSPVILISETVEEEDETEVETEALNDHKELLEDTEEPSSESWSTAENAEIIDSTGLSWWNSETLILRHISKEVLYFLLFVAFLVTVYHYDFVACFALYIFSVCWLYCQGGKNSESFSKK